MKKMLLTLSINSMLITSYASEPLQRNNDHDIRFLVEVSSTEGTSEEFVNVPLTPAYQNRKREKPEVIKPEVIKKVTFENEHRSGFSGTEESTEDTESPSMPSPASKSPPKACDIF